MKPHGKPKLYEKPETSQYNRNFTKNRKPHEKPETLRKTQDFSDLEVYKKHAPARKTGTSGKSRYFLAKTGISREGVPVVFRVFRIGLRESIQLSGDAEK